MTSAMVCNRVALRLDRRAVEVDRRRRDSDGGGRAQEQREVPERRWQKRFHSFDNTFVANATATARP